MNDHEYSATTDRVRKVVNSLSPSGGLHNIRIRAPDPRKHSLRLAVENVDGVSLNDLAAALAPARIFVRASNEVGSKLEIYFPEKLRNDLFWMEMGAWTLAALCLGCFLRIVL